MDDLASKLGELLNNPGSLEQIKNLAGLLGGSAAGAPAIPPAPAPQPPQPEQPKSTSPLDGDTVTTIMKVAPLLSAIRQEDDNTRLLHALRPLLGPERQKKLDEAIKLLQLMRVLPLLKSSGLFNLF
ncbi:hypothetical protein [Caproiciproducens sp. LBM24188]|jgi:hypothetical protein|nr:hypothetical protein [Oscillospiraceae bacterium]HHV30865.1 hypothetical protein [Clostridiales bacterium]